MQVPIVIILHLNREVPKGTIFQDRVVHLRTNLMLTNCYRSELEQGPRTENQLQLLVSRIFQCLVGLP